MIPFFKKNEELLSSRLQKKETNFCNTQNSYSLLDSLQFTPLLFTLTCHVILYII